MPQPAPATAGMPDPGGPPARLVRGRYQDRGLRQAGGVHLVPPTGPAWSARRRLAAPARQIAGHASAAAGPARAGSTAAPAGEIR